MCKPFPGLFLSWLFNFMYFPSVQFFLTSLFSWDCWDPDSLVAQVLFALPAALFSFVRFAHLLDYCACICTSSYFLVVTLCTFCICSFVRNPFYKLAWFYLQFVFCILYCVHISFRCIRAWPIRPRRGDFVIGRGPGSAGLLKTIRVVQGTLFPETLALPFLYWCINSPFDIVDPFSSLAVLHKI